MSEYIVNVPDGEAECFIARFGLEDVTLFGYSLTGEIIRCRDCKWFLEDDVYGDACRWFCRENDNPDGFCKWGERRGV